ncbi:hypothetical protein ACFPOE_02745 [Caenimonas terrae]|uniref:Uncharacterized protein n=1 Tax=Caenimonas terrae TaxID=696074 RepID=A0ABW0NA36_9BURK
MALKGNAVLAMWWDIAPPERPGFEHWHTSEHFPERLAVPGFLRGSRWVAVSAVPHYFVMYELAGLEVVRSQQYLDRVNNPTPWSTRTMAGFRNMVRSQCAVQGSLGSGIAHAMLTVRFSPQHGQAETLRAWLVDVLLPALVAKPGVSSAHLLQNMAPPGPPQVQTAEQKLRGGDASADWVLLASGYDRQAVTDLADNELNEDLLVHRGAARGVVAGVYRLGYAMAAGD